MYAPAVVNADAVELFGNRAQHVRIEVTRSRAHVIADDRS
jgi:hypothetical protein